MVFEWWRDGDVITSDDDEDDDGKEALQGLDGRLLSAERGMMTEPV